MPLKKKKFLRKVLQVSFEWQNSRILSRAVYQQPSYRKSPHGDQHLISNDVTAKSSLKVMRILEQCDYRPKVQ